MTIEQAMDGHMRYARDHAVEIRAKIVAAAAVQLRDRGINGLSIATLMRTVGLTHGGFYNHFASRDALIIEALSAAIEERRLHWFKLAAELPEVERLAAIVSDYFNHAQRNGTPIGCIISSCGSEIGRSSAKMKRVVAIEIERLIGAIAASIPTTDRAQAKRTATTAFATMLGTVILARAMPQPEVAAEIVDAGRLQASITA